MISSGVGLGFRGVSGGDRENAGCASLVHPLFRHDPDARHRDSNRHRHHRRLRHRRLFRHPRRQTARCYACVLHRRILSRFVLVHVSGLCEALCNCL